MVINNKKGYLKTFEAIISLFILLGVIIYSLSLKQVDEPVVPEDIKLAQKTAIDTLEKDPEFRLKMVDCSLSTVGVLASYLDKLYSALGFIMYTAECDDFYGHPLAFQGPTDRPVYTTSVILFNENHESRVVIIKIWRKEV